MKTVRDACEVQDNALSIKLSDQIEQLDQLIHGEGEGEAFFGKTHITQGMQDLISEGIARLAGMSSQAVFHLKQHLRQKARDVFELRYKETINPDQNRWELCSRVLSRWDVEEKLSEPW
jgi:hypothetical protein